MIYSNHFTDRALQIGFNITPDSHHFIHAESTFTIKPNHSKIETRYVNKNLREMATDYARLINRYKPKYKVLFSAGFDKQEENGQTLVEIELFNKLGNEENLTQNNINNILNSSSQLEHQIIKQETKFSGWRFWQKYFDDNNFFKTTERNNSSHVKTPLRSSAILNIENDESYCFFNIS